MNPDNSLTTAVSLGWSIIPVQKNKKPDMKWGVYQTRKPTEAEMKKWNGAPAYAVICGAISGIVIIDFDGEKGLHWLKEWNLKPHVRTGSGGYHVYVKHPGWRVKTLNSKSKEELGKRWAGVDIRADGGYAVFFGVNEVGPYTWLRPMEDIDPVTVLPMEVQEFFGLNTPPQEELVPKTPETARQSDIDRLEESWNASAPPAPAKSSGGGPTRDKLISKALDRISGGDGRNDSGFWLATQLRDNRYSRAEAEQAMNSFVYLCPQTNTKGKPEPYTIKDALASLSEAYKAAPREPWGNRPNTQSAKPTKQEPEEPPRPKTPLYQANEIHDATDVVVVQSEGSADLLLSMGITACSPAEKHGALDSDFAPLKNKKIIIWRSNDKSGLEYQADVRLEMEKLGNSGNIWSVQVERLSLNPAEDVVDYVNEMKTNGSSEKTIKASVKHVIRCAIRIGALATGSTLHQLAAYDVSNDPTTLLGKRWLCQGGSAFINGQTGIGKSTIAMQMAITWASGKSFFGIQPIRPLRSMFIQAENDKGDLAEQAQGVLKGMGIIDDLDNFNDNLLLFDEDELAGDGFLQRLEYLTSVYRPDLVFIDPLHAYLGGDINEADVCSKFLRRGLNPIAHRYKCAIFVVHHTKKPSSDIIKKFSMGDYSYFGAGSAELGNWPRAIVILRELEEADKLGEGFQLIASKRGKRAGLSTSEAPFDESQQGNQMVFVKHSPVGLCWLPRDESDTAEDESDVDGTNDDITLTVRAVFKEMQVGQTYEQADLREVFCKVTGTKFSSQLNNRGKKRNQWQACLKFIPRNPQAPAKFMKQSDEMPKVHIATKKPKKSAPASDQSQPPAAPEQPQKQGSEQGSTPLFYEVQKP
jgi:hypothetical protein